MTTVEVFEIDRVRDDAANSSIQAANGYPISDSIRSNQAIKEKSGALMSEGMFRSPISVEGLGIRSVLEKAVGWSFGLAGECYAPFPGRALATTSLYGVPVEAVREVNERSEVPGEIFGMKAKERIHTIGVGGASIGLYVHDVDESHIAAAAVGGTELFDLILPPGFDRDDFDPIVVADAYEDNSGIVSSAVCYYVYRAQQGLRLDRVIFGGLVDIGLSPRQEKARLEKLNRVLETGLERLELI